nr:thyroglobulin-like [Salvelinus alpinus]
MQLLCDVETRTWVTEAPLPQACQRLQVLQTVQTSVVLQLPCLQARDPAAPPFTPACSLSTLRHEGKGLCSLQLMFSSVSVCDESSVSVECVSEESASVQVSWRRSSLRPCLSLFCRTCMTSTWLSVRRGCWMAARPDG